MKPKCYNCKHAGESFKVLAVTNLHCTHPELVTAYTSPWESLKEWWDKCNKHEQKEVVK